jgi:hypothetical protein
LHPVTIPREAYAVLQHIARERGMTVRTVAEEAVECYFRYYAGGQRGQA